MTSAQPLRLPLHVTATALVLVALSSCSTVSDASRPESRRATGAETASTVNSPAVGIDSSRGALDAYAGMWADMVNASHTANWKDGSLPRHASGAALAQMVQGLTADQQKGLVTKGSPVLHPRIAQMSPTAADITDCASDTSWLEYIAATGKPANDNPGGNHLITAHVELAGGVWRVTHYQVDAVGSC